MILAFGERSWISASARTSFGSEASIWAASWSVPPAVYFSLQCAPPGSGLRQSVAAPAKPASLPPMPTVTRSVVGVSRSNWAGLVSPVGNPVCGA
jgi:hypothetical protein